MQVQQNREEWKELNYISSAEFFVYLSTLSTGHLFTIKGRHQRLEGAIRGDFQFPNFSAKWKKLEVQPRLVFKKTNVLFFSWIRKNWEVQQEQHWKVKKIICELQTTWKYNPRPTLKNPYFKSMDESRKICFPLRKIEFWTNCEFYAWHRIFGFRENPEHLCRLFDVLPKETTCEMKTPSRTSLHSTMISLWRWS